MRFDYSDGHTPGLALAEVGGEGGVAFCSDLIPGGRGCTCPSRWATTAIPELLIDEKRRFLEDKIARSVRLFFTHDPECAVATPVRGDDGRFGVTAEQRDARRRSALASALTVPERGGDSCSAVFISGGEHG